MIFASHQLLENPSFLQLLVFTVYLVRRISPFYFLIQILDTSGNMFLDKEINAKGKSSGLGYISRSVTTCTDGMHVRTWKSRG